MNGVLQRRLALLLIIQTVTRISFSLNVTRPGKTDERDSFSNLNCLWQSCSKYLATCATSQCCECTCNTGSTFMSSSKLCESEDEITKGCNFMAHANPTAPWSFTPITITSKNNILVGLHLFHCKTSGCKVARKCNINRVSYENGGWRDFPSSSDSKIDILNDLLKITGKECNNRRFEGLLLKLKLSCNIEDQLSQNTTSCLVMKIAGNYEFGDVPLIGRHCPSETIDKMSSIYKPSPTLIAPSTFYKMTTTNRLHPTQSNALIFATVNSISDISLSRPGPSIKPTFTSAIRLIETSVPYTILNSLSIERKPGSQVTIRGEFTTTMVIPSPAKSSYGGGFITVVSSFTHDKTTVVTLPSNQGRHDKNDVMSRDKCLIISSATAAAVAFVFIILLVIVLLLLRRKRLIIRELKMKAMSQGLPTDQQILTFQGFNSSPCPSESPQLLPAILKLRSIHNNENMNKDEYNAEIEDVYDVPIDPPHLQKSLSLLYAYVDKSHKNYAAEDDDIYSAVGDNVSESTRVSNDAPNDVDAIYDEPEKE